MTEGRNVPDSEIEQGMTGLEVEARHRATASDCRHRAEAITRTPTGGTKYWWHDKCGDCGSIRWCNDEDCRPWLLWVDYVPKTGSRRRRHD